VRGCSRGPTLPELQYVARFSPEHEHRIRTGKAPSHAGRFGIDSDASLAASGLPPPSPLTRCPPVSRRPEANPIARPEREIVDRAQLKPKISEVVPEREKRGQQRGPRVDLA
jgi:hypothetical protein